MTLLEKCIEVLRQSKKPMHVKEIALAVIESFGLSDQRKNLDAFTNKVTAALSGHVKRKNPSISKIKNKQGGYKRGIYKAKVTRSRRHDAPTPIPDVSTAYTGKAGEYGFLSELLFRGYNASIMSVDEGIDVVASKNNKYFHIQVKTSNENNSNKKYHYTIRPSSYKLNDDSSTFYVFILRKFINELWRSEYVIISSMDIRKYVDTGVITKGAQYSITISFKDEKCILNSKENISWNVNRFDILV